MNSILVACASPESAQRGLRVASDLSAASGAALSLVYVPWVPKASGLDALGLLSEALFEGRKPFPVWLTGLRWTVEECWEAAARDLPAQVQERRPNLVMTCDAALANLLVESTERPVWRIRSRQPERSWFTSRKIRCAVSGSRAASWAGAFAEGLGAELQIMRARLISREPSDLVVVDREQRSPILGWQSPPLVVV